MSTANTTRRSLLSSAYKQDVAQIRGNRRFGTDASSADSPRPLDNDPRGAGGLAGGSGYRPGILESFSYRSFRFQWSSDGFAQWGFEMEALILGWFVLVETGSPFLVGLVGALRFVGTLGGPFYGLIVDRFDRRKLLIGSRGLLAVLALITATLALTDSLVAWHAFVIATLLGSLRMFDNVVRQSLIADVVPRGTLLNAMGLSRLHRHFQRANDRQILSISSRLSGRRSTF